MNCHTFTLDFVDGFCNKIRSFPDNKVEAFHNYLLQFFIVQLPENKQVFHEGSLDVLESAILLLPEDRQNYPESSRRLILPPEILQCSQLTSTVTERSERVSAIPFSEVLVGNKSLSESLSETTVASNIRLPNGAIITKQVNKRIAELRKKQERELMIGIDAIK